MNQCAFRHSARNLPLNDSMKALSVGLSGREKSRTTPLPHSPGAPLFFSATRDELRASDPLAHEWRDGNGRAVRLT